MKVHVPELVVRTAQVRGQEVMIAFWVCVECSDFEAGFYMPDDLCPVFGPTVADERRPPPPHFLLLVEKQRRMRDSLAIRAK